MRVLACLDFSERTREVLETGFAHAAAFNAELVLVSVGAPDSYFVPFEVGPEYELERLEQEHEKVHALLDGSASEGRRRGLNAIRTIYREGVPADTLLTVISEETPDLVVIGSHGHGAIYQALLGSTSETVLHKATVPVVVVPLHDRD